MSVTKQVSILFVDIFKINDNDIYELYQSNIKRELVFSHIPEWTLNPKGNLIETENYLQFVGHIKEKNPKEYLVFNFKADGWLNEEISQSGIDDTFKDINFKEIFEKVIYDIPEYNKRWKIISNPLYLVVETTWITSYDGYSGGYDCESESEIIGYLNSNLEKILFDNNG